MKNQPQRLLLPKNRKSSALQSSDDDDSSIENDSRISTKPQKESASLSMMVRDDDRSRTKHHKNAVSFATNKPSSFAAASDDISSSDGDSSSSDSDDSHVNISRRNKKKTNRTKAMNNNNLKSSKKSTMPRATFTKVANRVNKAGIRASENAPSSTASSKANKARIPEGITSPSQLQWFRIIFGQNKKGTREKLQPCRKLSKGEVFDDYNRKHGSGIDNNNQGTTFIEYLSLSNDSNNNKNHHLCVDDNLLIPFGYRSRDGISFTFNDDYLHRYMQEQRKISSPSELEAQQLFIERVFSHAIRMEKESKEHANKDLEDYYADCSFEKGDNTRVQFEVEKESNDDNNDDVSNDEELDAPYTQAITFDPDKFEPMDENKTSNESIRVGDVIEYYSPIMVAGDPRGLRQATVLAIDPKNEIPLVLDNVECIPDDTNVKRIKIKSDGELVDHPGIFRPISRFKLVKAGRATMADAMKKQSSRFGDIMRNNMKKLKSKAQADGFAPMDLLVNIKGVNDSSQSSSEVSVHKRKPKVSRRIQRQSLPSSSSESSADDSSDDDDSPIEKSKPLASSTREVEIWEKERAATPKLKENKENASSAAASRRDRNLSLGSLSSNASLGTSLASSSNDDSSIESALLNLGKNHKHMTQQCQQNKDDVINKTKTSGVLDLSISSDESVKWSPKKAQKRSTGVSSTKHTSLKEYLSSDSSSVSSVSSSEVTKPRKLKSGTSYKSKTGLSEKRSELRKRTPDTKKTSSYSSSSAGKASLSENSSASSTKRKRTPQPNNSHKSSQKHSSESSKLTPTTNQRKEIDSEATNDLGWTQTSGGWVKSNEHTGFSLSIGRFK